MQGTKRPGWLGRGLRTTIGTKYLMAATGLLLFLFVVAHLLGNLSLYRGQDAVNSYAAMLKGTGPLLWAMRLGLLAILLVHLRCAFTLAARNRGARPVGYFNSAPIQSTLASRTMLLSGAVILLFLIYHLLHFTIGAIHGNYFQQTDALGRHDVYSMTVMSFQFLPTAFIYIAAMALLGMHLHHGLQSFLQSLGFTRPKYRNAVHLAASGLTALIVLGNISLPLAVQMGIIQLPGGAS